MEKPFFISLRFKHHQFMEQRMNLKAWAEEDKPREKLLKKGLNALSDAELLAILLRTGTRNETVVELSRRILNSVLNNLDELGKLSINDLQKGFKGIGQTKAITLIAALELGRRRKLAQTLERTQIRESLDIYHYFEPILADLPHEEFWILLLNRHHKIIQSVCISKGGVAGTVVDIRLIMRHALEQLASSIVICHNHPSGNKNPSEGDRKITQSIKEAGQLMEIQLIDHIIIAGKTYYSFADEGLLY